MDLTQQETIILNVVSAMVDFSTSASLQLSQELDPAGRRTLLCVTKIDQHRESGLAKKVRFTYGTSCITGVSRVARVACRMCTR